MQTKGRYEIRGVLGEGGMGIVYRALDPVLNREVTLKTIRDPQDQAVLELFKRECAVLAGMSHPNIVEMFDIGEFEEGGITRPYFVMPLLQGSTLQDLIRSSSPRLTVERCVQIISQVCRGLQASHDHGLVHRDIKPSNIWVLQDDSVKIIDFGVAHLTGHRSVTGMKGTLLYMSPEQLQHRQPTPLSDQFSVAVVCYEMLARRHPFEGVGEKDVAQAILNHVPASVADLNPIVGASISQVIHKALAKEPVYRFSHVREFSDCLQKALRGEPIDIFDPVRIAPRLTKARKSFDSGDLDGAAEIIKELESENYLAPEIADLRGQIEQQLRAKTVKNLLETARRRFDEEEFNRALQKVQGVLDLDPSNTEAFTLKGAIESKRSGAEIEKWFRLAQEHVENRAYTHARQALEKILELRPADARAQGLLAEVGRREQDHIRLRNEKQQVYQSAVDAYKRGELNSALNKLERVLDLDRRAPDTSAGQGAAYQKLYEEVRSKRDQLASQEAEARRHLNDRSFAAAKNVCDEVLAVYPSNVVFLALRDDVEEAQRQEISAYVARIDKEVAAEPDPNRKVAILVEASAKYPFEARFEQALRQARSRRDLVDSIVGRARSLEEGRQFSEALGQWETLRNIHPQYPGLNIEIDRVKKRREQQARIDAQVQWVSQVEEALAMRNFEKASALAAEALAEFPGDAELTALAKHMQQARSRALEAEEKTRLGKQLCESGDAAEGLETLREAFHLDSHHPAVRAALIDAILQEASRHADADWRAAEPFIQEALELDPSNPRAKSLSTLIQDKRQAQEVSAALSRARELQTQGSFKEAIAEIDKLRPTYPRESRLMEFRAALKERLSGKDREEVRARDLEQLNDPAQHPTETNTVTELDSIFIRTEALSKDGGEAESRKPALKGEERLAEGKQGSAQIPSGPTEASQQSPTAPVLPGPAETSGWRAILRHPASKVLWPVMGIGVLALALTPALLKSLRRPAAPPPPTVLVRFQLDPKDAAISVDKKGIAGTTAEVAKGRHTVHAEKIGYKPVNREFSDRDASPLVLTLDPELDTIRISADGMKTAKVLLNDADIGLLEDGSFTYELPFFDKHTLRLSDGKTQVSLEFEAGRGLPARLLLAPRVGANDLPVNVVSSLGSSAIAYSSVPGMRVVNGGGDPKPVPPDGLELTLPPGGNEVIFDDGKKQVSFPLVRGNAPELAVRVGAATKGTLLITSNVVGAHVFIRGQQSSRPVGVSGWQQSLDPGDYVVQLKLDGYDDSPVQRFTISTGKTATQKIDLAPSVTTASLQVRGGTSGAQVWLDGQTIGSLDNQGTFDFAVKPDVEHQIQFKKANFQDSAVVSRRAAVKGVILISGAEAKLKEFGRLVLTQVDPPNAEVTIQPAGGARRPLTDRSAPTPLPDGDYTVRGTASEEYELFEQRVQIRLGGDSLVAVVLNRKARPEPVKSPTPAVEPPASSVPLAVPTLFKVDPGTWMRNSQGFYIHQKTASIDPIYFSHGFDVLRIGKRFGHEKISWRIFLNRDDPNNYLEFELADKDLIVREVHPGKTDEKKKPHGLTPGSDGFYHIDLTVAADGVSYQIGQAQDKLQYQIEGHTAFIDKFGLRLTR